MSEGEFDNMRPHIPGHELEDKNKIDESSDTYDTIEWLLKHIKNHNGKVGQWGISYPGFYSAAGMIDSHPALKAVSPQAPIADWFFDDFHHHGAFFLPHAFNFMATFGQARPEPTTQWGKRFKHGTPDGYQFFMDLGFEIDQESAKSHDVDQLVGQDVETEGQQPQFRRPLNGGQNRMILKTDFIEIILRRTQRRVFSLPAVTNDLGKGAVDDFTGGQISQRFDIVAVSKPLVHGQFVGIAHQLFSHDAGFVNDF